MRREEGREVGERKVTAVVNMVQSHRKAQTMECASLGAGPTDGYVLSMSASEEPRLSGLGCSSSHRLLHTDVYYEIIHYSQGSFIWEKSPSVSQERNILVF